MQILIRLQSKKDWVMDLQKSQQKDEKGDKMEDKFKYESKVDNERTIYKNVNPFARKEVYACSFYFSSDSYFLL